MSPLKEHDEILAIQVDIEYKPIKLSKIEKNGIELSAAKLKVTILKCFGSQHDVIEIWPIIFLRLVKSYIYGKVACYELVRQLF